MSAQQWVYFFGGGGADGTRDQKALLGGKGANLAEMTRIGVPVPPGFTITTEACRHYMKHRDVPAGLLDEVNANLAKMEQHTGRTFGGGSSPLLVSVRSGAAVSMPGMMDTILNLGLNDETVEALADESSNPRFAYDSYRRFVHMYGDVVLNIKGDRFEHLLERMKDGRGVHLDTELTADDLRTLVRQFKELVLSETGKEFPADPHEQLWGAIRAVFNSWETPRARAYRRINNIADDLGTGVNVMAMVFGNLGNDSGTGVAFTRNPSTGTHEFFGEFLVNAQGEDVVAGVRDPQPIEEMAKAFPPAYAELLAAAERLEKHYREMQDLEFTVERGKLYLLQTRTGKRTANAAVRIAVEMVNEEVISREEAVLRVEPDQLNQLLHPMIDPNAELDVLTAGLPAAPGAASGHAVFNPEEAAERGHAGEAIILVRRETSPEDFEGMVASRAVLTARGGMTSHAAVVARGMGKCCVVGASEIKIDEAYGRFTVDDRIVKHDDWITLDGATGRVIWGKVPTVEPELGDHFRTLMGWADEIRRLSVRANADNPNDAAKARHFGAAGIGLCRTEHMFFEEGRIDAVREMILSETVEGRRKALAKLLPMQREDFEGIFRAMDGLPVTIRLLDPPLHEFLPVGSAEIKSLAKKMGVDAARLRQQVENHREANPMLGHRGVRLGITIPEITIMQARAIFEAAVNVSREGVVPIPEIMVPLVGTVEELRHQRKLIEETANKVLREAGVQIEYLIGTMIELPRAALTADRIAAEADFFSFGTNDLTQTTLGLSRDDAGSFLPHYIDHGILPGDPFQSLDQEGVGQLVEIGTRKGRVSRPSLKVGVCGEHGGDPRSINFFHRTGLDYVSCSPYRVPIARLAAAHAAIAGTRSATSVPAEKPVPIEVVAVA
ncbi:MAG: pyruvate, phosphate dikinase [Gemmatimonadota bacterium]|jgi:pyruvate,orthophosphate dikinase|nr:pyruvate, phosphate dikinase [Gemmatimonadota bacterium]